MLESIRKGQRWLTGVLVALVGGVFVFFMGLGQPLQGGPSQGIVVELGDIRLSLADFNRVRAQQADSYRNQLGDQFNNKVGRSFLDAQALRALIDRAILANDAHELGLRVGTQEIQRVIMQSTGPRDEAGRFDRDGFSDWVEYSYGNQRNYVEFMRRALLGQKMVRLLYAQGEVSEGEARSSALHRLEQVQLATVAIDAETLPPGAELSSEEVAGYAAENEPALQALYQERLESFQLPARMQLRHILFELPASATPGELEEARARAEAALARLETGVDFAAVATELSDDRSSREDGGNLGLIETEDIADELVQAANSLAVAERSGIVRSDRGLHILLLEERIDAGVRAFDDVRDELAREGATRRVAAERADRLSDELATAIRDGKSLEEAARERELEIARTGMLRRRADGYVVGLGASRELLAMAFALSSERPSSPEIFSVGSKLVLIQLLDRTAPDDAVLATALAGERERLASAKQNAFVQNWIAKRRTQLTESGQLRIDNSVVEGS